MRSVRVLVGWPAFAMRSTFGNDGTSRGRVDVVCSMEESSRRSAGNVALQSFTGDSWVQHPWCAQGRPVDLWEGEET